MVTIKSKEVMKSSWMPFIYGGGIFFPTKSKLSLGDEIFLIATIPGEPNKFPTSTRGAWLSPLHPSSGLPQGVGLQLMGSDGAALKSKIETMLSGTKEEVSFSI